jgi:aminoglycoside 2''-phosphotransferase
VLREQLPSAPLSSIEHIGSGWDYDAYLADRTLVVRFPRRAEVAESRDREEAILGLVASFLQPPPAVPTNVLWGSPSPHFPHRFFGHELVPGASGDDPSVAVSPALASDVGAALSRIHGIPADAASAVGIGVEEEGGLARYEEAVRRVTRAPAVQATVAQAASWVLSKPDVPDEHTGPRRFIHNDLCPEHILVDPASGRLSGVIDWSDAALGDPALDFVALVHWRGWAFAWSALGSYELSLDPGFHARLRFLSRILAVKWLFDAAERGGDVAKHRRWVVNAFEPATRRRSPAPEP